MDKVFVPVVTGSRETRGFETAPTRRLVGFLVRYRALKDAPDSPESMRTYARDIAQEIRAELNRRHTATTSVRAAAAEVTA